VSSPDAIARVAPVLTRSAALSDVESSSDNGVPATKVTKGGKKAAEPVDAGTDAEEEEDDDDVGEDECARHDCPAHALTERRQIHCREDPRPPVQQGRAGV
jgi:hypothetical protein